MSESDERGPAGSLYVCRDCGNGFAESGPQNRCPDCGGSLRNTSVPHD